MRVKSGFQPTHSSFFLEVTGYSLIARQKSDNKTGTEQEEDSAARTE
jgi:hypothetical protein